jgi:DNA-binding PadR family transcriptional regulator
VQTKRKLKAGDQARRRVRRARKTALTTPDLVLLSLLAERPMHGYQANAELERRCVRDWAAISRPQVYYSLEKLARERMVRGAESGEPAAGPERQVYETTAAGRAALAQALEAEGWTIQRERPAFLTWMALSWQAKPDAVRKQLERRRKFLEEQIAREKETLESVLEEVGHENHEAVWMITLMIGQFETELQWLEKIVQELPARRRARNPQYAAGES